MQTTGATRCLALDCGASSIRLIEIALDGGRLGLSELARFDNAAQSLGARLVWDYEAIYRKIAAALARAGSSGLSYASIGADSWGVDYVLIDKRGELLGPAVSYRDPRTNGQIARYFARHFTAHDLFAATGIQCLQFNTVFQLHAQFENEPELLRRAHRLLFTADYAHYWLSGVAANERTLASTSQMLSPYGFWSMPILNSVGLPASALAPPVPAGTVLGAVRPQLARETGLRDVMVIAPAAHDTQSAVLCTPAAGGEDWAYLSSGTWSILGMEAAVAFTDAGAERAGISNESGYGGTCCVQSTVAGLWLVQEIQRLVGGVSVAGLAAAAARTPAFRSLVDPADPRFFNPADMTEEIRAACREEREPVPETPAELARCAYDSLALLYRAELQKLSAVTGRSFTKLHVVGGGSKVDLLNRLCAAAIGLPVLAGPAEATAIGNALAQLIALGRIDGAQAARAVVAQSFPVTRFEPENLPQLDDAIGRFERIRKMSGTKPDKEEIR